MVGCIVFMQQQTALSVISFQYVPEPIWEPSSTESYFLCLGMLHEDPGSWHSMFARLAALVFKSLQFAAVFLKLLQILCVKPTCASHFYIRLRYYYSSHTRTLLPCLSKRVFQECFFHNDENSYHDCLAECFN